MATYAEVIYCKNCKYCEKVYDKTNNKEYLLCEQFSKSNNEFWVNYWDFCSWGDYKEEKNNGKR